MSLSALTSGNPFKEVTSDIIAAKAAEDNAIPQLIEPRNAAPVGIAAKNACAKVLTARINLVSDKCNLEWQPRTRVGRSVSVAIPISCECHVPVGVNL